MAACIWVQYEPLDSTTPGLYPGFIHATVSGDDQNPPPLDKSRSQVAVAPGTLAFGKQFDPSAKSTPMMIDVLQANIPALPQSLIAE